MKTSPTILAGCFAIAACLLPTPAFSADTVVPTERVSVGVFVRKSASARSAKIAILEPGQQAELLDSVPRWHRIKLSDGRSGYVSKAWTEADTGDPLIASVSEGFSVHVVDVGTGLAMFVRGPDFLALFDGGSNDDTARGNKNRLLAYMRAVFPDARGIDHVLLSHPHKDHVELLPDILTAYDVTHVWDSGAVNDICPYRALIAAVAQAPSAIYRSARNGAGSHPVRFGSKRCYGRQLRKQTIQLRHGARVSPQPVSLGDGAQMIILHADGSDFGSSFNHNSLVVRFDLGGKRILVMGDAEAGGRASPGSPVKPNSIEGKLLACCRDDLRADILVVGHHGSMTSSRTAFLDAVQARVFVVSAGPKKYQSVVLPDAVVIAELKRRGRVLRTDLNDESCKTRARKIGPGSDGRAGGCDNIRIELQTNADGVDVVAAGYWRKRN